MNICLCGAEAGYPHEPSCPYPLYRASAAQADDWLRARADKRARARAEWDKTPKGGREVTKAAEFRRAWATLEAAGACDTWGSLEWSRVWREYVEHGMPDDVSEFIRRRANVLSDGTEPRTA